MSSAILSFTIRYNGISRILSNEVEVAQAFNPKSGEAHSHFSIFRAIWDTGATNSVVSPRVVTKCGLQPIDITRTQTAGGKRLSKVYLVSMGLPNRIVVPLLRVTECEIGDDFDVLVGMDIINQGDFAVSNLDGKTTFTFRVPSISETDFETRS